MDKLLSTVITTVKIDKCDFVITDCIRPVRKQSLALKRNGYTIAKNKSLNMATIYGNEFLSQLITAVDRQQAQCPWTDPRETIKSIAKQYGQIVKVRSRFIKGVVEYE